MTPLIYLDYNSTTPLDPRVLEAMLPYFTEQFANPSSAHNAGKQVRLAIERARRQVSDLIGADSDEIVFTSGATEAINLGLKGALSAQPDLIVYTNKAEHSAVLDTCKYLEQHGVEVKYVAVNGEGMVEAYPYPGLVVQMLANNETGVINQVEKTEGQQIFIDATQAVGKIPVDVDALDADMLSLSAHKIYGPKGIGALYVRRGMKVSPQIHGGGHERGLRSGTLNAPAIIGFGVACEIAAREMGAEAVRLKGLRDTLETSLLEINGAHLNGHAEKRLPNTSNISFPGMDGSLLVALLGDIAVSNGSACTSAVVEPSHVLKAMGLTDGKANSALRCSLGRFTTQADILIASSKVKTLLNA